MTTLWAVGLIIVTLGRGYAIDAKTGQKFSAALDEADLIEQTHVNEAHLQMEAAYNRYYRSKGWFSCDSYCQTQYQSYLKAQEQMKDAKALHDAAISEARATVGIFSDYAVQDARRLFWSCWEWGKNFAKRISFYDAIFLAMDSRNEGLGGYLARMVVRLLVNFTIGFFSALVSFVWQLAFFVWSYKAGIAGLAFFILGSVAAFSLVASAIGAMYVGTATAAAVVVTMARPQIQGGAGRRRQRLHYD